MGLCPLKVSYKAVNRAPHRCLVAQSPSPPAGQATYWVLCVAGVLLSRHRTTLGRSLNRPAPPPTAADQSGKEAGEGGLHICPSTPCLNNRILANVIACQEKGRYHKELVTCKQLLPCSDIMVLESMLIAYRSWQRPSSHSVSLSDKAMPCFVSVRREGKMK